MKEGRGEIVIEKAVEYLKRLRRAEEGQRLLKIAGRIGEPRMVCEGHMSLKRTW